MEVKHGMSKARERFDVSIQDAEDLLQHFDSQPKPPPPNAEVLKRAGLVMAFTAWETYVEDLIEEVVMGRNPPADAGHAERFMLTRLQEELKRLHNPTSDKTRKLFLDYAGIDVTKHWKWSNYEPSSVKKKLDELLGIRGDIVHRSKAPDDGGPSKAHPVKREDLAKAIRFLKGLVDATDKAFV
jgi:RiboL-PSP-HEPN